MSLWLEAREFLGEGETEADTLRITSLHSSEYWVSYELPSWHCNEWRTSVGTIWCDLVMQVCHAGNSCDKQGDEELLESQTVNSQRSLFVLLVFLLRGQATYLLLSLSASWLTPLECPEIFQPLCFQVVCVLQSECLQNCQATWDSINDLYVHSQCSCLWILSASAQPWKEKIM